MSGVKAEKCSVTPTQRVKSIKDAYSALNIIYTKCYVRERERAVMEI